MRKAALHRHVCNRLSRKGPEQEALGEEDTSLAQVRRGRTAPMTAERPVDRTYAVPGNSCKDRQRLRRLLLDGARSAPGAPADTAYFDQLRKRVCNGYGA